MSGGSFDYAFGRMADFAEELGKKLDERTDFPDESVLPVLQQVKDYIDLGAKMAKEVEWLYSGDIGEETFIENMSAIGKEG